MIVDSKVVDGKLYLLVKQGGDLLALETRLLSFELSMISKPSRVSELSGITGDCHLRIFNAGVVPEEWADSVGARQIAPTVNLLT